MGEHPSPEARGWLFLQPQDIPERWRSRGMDVRLVPLLPEEVEGILLEGKTEPALEGPDEAVARLVARGLTVTQIAGELRMAPRTVDRHVARLRERFGVQSTAELSSLLARWGF